MWFKKKVKAEITKAYAGNLETLSGLETAVSVSSLCTDKLLVESESGVGPQCDLIPAEQIPGQIAGMAATGLRSAALMVGSNPIINTASALAGKHLPCIFHLAPRARDRQANAIQGGHDACHALADLGPFQLHASSVQEVADLALIAHRAAELSLTPGICVQDLYATGLSVQQLRLPDQALCTAYLGQASDEFETPTAAQRILFGARRRRIPRLLDLDRPVGLGGYQDQDSFPLAVAAQQSFFSDHVATAIEQAMDEFAKLTGRAYGSIVSHRIEDAEQVVVCLGAADQALAMMVDDLRDRQQLKIGLLSLTVLRPFPGAQLSHVLKGKRWVSVLERSDAPLSEDPPLLRELRAAIDKASENGAAPGVLPHPIHASYQKPADRPQFCSGTYGIGCGLPPEKLLAAVFANMQSETPARRFYLGVDFNQNERRFPQLQVLQQDLKQAYPRLADLTLPTIEFTGQQYQGQVIRLHSSAGQRGIEAGNVIARALAATPGCQVRSEAKIGTESTLEAGCLTLAYGTEPCHCCPGEAHTILVSGEALLDSVTHQAVRQGGRLIITTAFDDEAVWRGLSRRVCDWIRDRQLAVYLLEIRALPESGEPAGAMLPPWSDQWSVWALLGAAILLEDADLNQACEQRLRMLLQDELGAETAVIDEILQCYQQGHQARALDWRSLDSKRSTPQPELEAPWTVKQSGEQSQLLFDPTRFWHSVGYLHDSGQTEYILPDPMVATGVIPAGSSAHRNLSPHRFRTPTWLPENCTGCGLCWSTCPDSALPATVQPVEQWILSAMEQCKASGQPLTQMNRISGHLVKMTEQVMRKDELRQHRTAGSLLQTAFVQLMEKMGLDGDGLAAMRAEFDRVREQLADWPFAHTDRYSGELLTIPFNPSSCKGCGLCIEVCPEKAFDWRQYLPELEQVDRKNWAFRMRLPDPAMTSTANGTTPTTPSDRLLDRDVYHTLVGGDSAVPGLGPKIAVHLLTAAMESVMKGRYQQHANYLADLLDRLRAKIQGEVAATVQINDFDEFSQRLESLHGEVNSENLAQLFGSNKPLHEIDPLRLQRMGHLLLTLEAQCRLYNEGHRARQMLALHPEISLWSGYYPDNPHANPWMSNGSDDTPALAMGLFDGIAAVLAEELSSCRQAEMEINDRFETGQPPARLNWQDFTADEMKLLPPVLMVAPARLTQWRDIAPVLAGSRPIKVALVDTGGAANDAMEDHAMSALDQYRATVLQSSIAYPEHLLEGVVASLESGKPALLGVCAPDPERCGIVREQVVDSARLAVDTRAVPLFYFDPEQPELDIRENPDHQDDWCQQALAVRDSQGGTRQLDRQLSFADWAVTQGCFRGHFRIVTKGHLNSGMRVLTEYLLLDADERGNFEPFINLVDQQQRHFIGIVDEKMVAMAETSLASWRRLQANAGSRSAAAFEPESASESDRIQAATEPVTTEAESLDSHQRLVEQLLAMSGYGNDSEFQGQSLRQFLETREQVDDPMESQ